MKIAEFLLVRLFITDIAGRERLTVTPRDAVDPRQRAQRNELAGDRRSSLSRSNHLNPMCAGSDEKGGAQRDISALRRAGGCREAHRIDVIDSGNIRDDLKDFRAINTSAEWPAQPRRAAVEWVEKTIQCRQNRRADNRNAGPDAARFCKM